MKLRFSHAPWILAAVVLACSSSGSGGGDAPAPNACGSDLTAFRFPSGTDGHADPFGAKAAGQARAGRVRDASQVVNPANGRSRPKVGDFVMANDKIALYIGSEARGDGYVPFGGKLIAIEPVGADGRPKGASMYGESLFLYGLQTVAPDKVSVLADGSDGKAAIVRATGTLKTVPFLEIFKALQPDEYDFPVAYDYVLEPGAEKVLLRVSMVNPRGDSVDFSTAQNIGFFHDYAAPTFTEEHGFDTTLGDLAFVANDGGDASFLFRVPNQPIRTGLAVQGFQLFGARGGSIDACQTTTFDYIEVLAGGPGLDGVLEAKRRTYGEPAWREIRGQLKETTGAPIAGAYVHATSATGAYFTRVTTDANGNFVLHAPATGVELTPTMKGYAVPPATPVADGAGTQDLSLPAHATISVTTKDSVTNETLPVRVQVIPASPLASPPPSFGVTGEALGRLHQEFATTGSADLVVPAGSHRVLVTRGYEYEIFDTTVNADPGTTVPVAATLTRSVDSTGIMCADFHIHSFFSVDAQDAVVKKVKAAIADGLDIPVSSEHEWIIDFQPVIKELGLEKWAFGFPSEELTTFSYGHFGIVPIFPKPELPNRGAFDWIGKQPPEVFDGVNALPEKPVLIVNHPHGGDFQAYFGSALFDRATAKGVDGKWSDNFGAIEVFNTSDFEHNRDGSVADWFALLNAGKAFMAVGNSDSHQVRTSPVGYPRNCMKFGHDDPTKLTAEIVRDKLREGQSTISGGLMIDVVGPGGVGSGGNGQPGSYTVTVLSPSWITATKLEVIVDGDTVQWVDLTAEPSGTGPGKKYVATVNVASTQSRPKHWVLFHAKGADGKDLSPLHPEKNPFAVTNPIWF